MPLCFKEPYESKGAATKAAYHAGIYNATPYNCTICGAWHLSSGQTRKKAHYKKTRGRGGKRFDKFQPRGY